MAAPWPKYPVMWELPVTADMASRVNVAAAAEGTSRVAWLRDAIEAHLARQRKARR